MTLFRSSETSKKLLLQFIRENSEYNKRCGYLQEIIRMGKKEEIWRRALLAYFDTSATEPASTRFFSVN